VSTDVSEEHISSIFKVEKNKLSKKPARKQVACTYWFLTQLIFSTLKMEDICYSEASVDTQRTTRRYIPEDGTLHNRPLREPQILQVFRYFLRRAEENPEVMRDDIVVHRKCVDYY
jgi:hypothetical protein